MQVVLHRYILFEVVRYTHTHRLCAGSRVQSAGSHPTEPRTIQQARANATAAPYTHGHTKKNTHAHTHTLECSEARRVCGEQGACAAHSTGAHTHTLSRGIQNRPTLGALRSVGVWCLCRSVRGSVAAVCVFACVCLCVVYGYGARCFFVCSHNSTHSHKYNAHASYIHNWCGWTRFVGVVPNRKSQLCAHRGATLAGGLRGGDGGP